MIRFRVNVVFLMSLLLWGFGSMTVEAQTTPTWSVGITVRDICGSSNLVTIGQGVGATTGIDSLFGEADLPPLPPIGGFDVRFIMRNNGAIASLRDIRNDTSHTLTWRMTFQGCDYPMKFSWDSSAFPAGYVYLNDEVSGAVVNVNMKQIGHLTVSNTGIVSLRIDLSSGIHANPWVMLQGAFVSSDDSMKASLRSSGALFAHFGGIPIPSHAVDSVCIEVRDSAVASKATIRRYAPAWLLSNGTLCGFADTTSDFVEFNSIPSAPYYIVVRHRNHLALMSHGPVLLTSSWAPYNFTSGQAKAYGTNPMIHSGGRYCLYAGDGNVDGQITTADFTPWLSNAKAALTGYKVTDYNLDGQNTTADFTMWLANAKAAATSQVP